MDGFTQQIRYSVRKLLRAPLFTAVAVLTLAVGIGSNAAIFSVVHAVLLKPLPYDEPDELVGVWHKAPRLGFDLLNQSPSLHFTYVEHGTAFDLVGMWDDTQLAVTGLAEPEQVDGMRVTWQALELLRVRPLMGRIFTEEDDTHGSPPTVLLSHGYWQRRFGGDPGVLGRTLTVNAVTREIVGVLPEGVRFLSSNPDIYVPFQWDPAQLFFGNFSYQALARLAPGVTIEQANDDIERMVPMAVEAFPGGMTLAMVRDAGFGANVRPLEADVVGDVGGVLWVLLGTVGIVLLIACANVANLFIVRAESRQRELAVRTAMGAGRGEIVGQLLTESALLAGLGGALGLALAYFGLQALVAAGPESLPRLHEIGLDATVVGFTAGVSVAAALLFGLFPALRYGRPDLVGSLKEGGRGGGAGKERHVARNALVVAQMALALVLLAGSGLMIRSFQALRAVDPGFDAPEEILTFRVAIPSAETSDPLLIAETHRQIVERVRAIPGVESAAISSSVTMDGWDSNDAVELEDFPVDADRIPPIRRFKWLGGDYFETMGNPILFGRAITWDDSNERNVVAVVTEDFAREYWGDPRLAIGKRLRTFGGERGPSPWREIVGVAENIHDDGMSEPSVPTVYWPHVVTDFWGEDVTAQASMAYAVRASAGDPMTLLDEVRRAVWAVNPRLPLARVRPLDGYVERSMARTSFTLVMLGIAAGVALFLGSVGIYGVVSYVVAQRTREIGVRMAMGAERAVVRRMVLRQALTLTGGGVAVGLLGALGLTRLIDSLLFGVSPLDPVTLASVALALTAVALLASWLPARRASRVEPVVALRFE